MQARNISVRDGDILLMIGTMKGVFLARSDGKRKRWDFGGPYHPGHPTYAVAFDGREGRRRIWAAVESPHFGSVLRTSDDFGRNWTQPEQANVKFPEDTKTSLKRIWQIEPGGGAEPNVLYCGVEPAALFESRDAGETWNLSRGLFDHPHRSLWQPGGGGLCLHTIIPGNSGRPEMLIAISTGGVYRTNGGSEWRPSNQGVRAQFLPDKQPEFGQCVHKIAPAAGNPRRLYLQNHFGLYRSDDSGQTWSDIANGVPSDFGFPIAAHPRDPETAFIVPLESDEFRCTVGGKLRVYRTRNGGRSWQPLTRGLPQQNAFETVLRDGLAVDSAEPAGIYFGTRSGRLYVSSNEGERWQAVIDGLPPIVCVKTATVGTPKARKTQPARSRGKSTSSSRSKARAKR